MAVSAGSASLRAGTIVSRYRVERLIGAGGMGEVYAAVDTSLGRKVALKILPQSRATDSERVRRFIREAEAASALNHPAIVAVYDSGTAIVDGDALHFVAMELVEGETLSSWSRNGRDLRRKLEILSGVADGLSRAHADGIVHRDLKPDNIMVARGGYPKILDFGIAKLTERGEAREDDTAPDAILGTAAYMSPEQAAGRRVDPRSDVFSFGCVMVEALTGRPAFRRGTAVETMNAILNDDAPAAPELPRDVARVIRRCLAKDPDDRYQSIRDVALELRDVALELRDIARDASNEPPSAPRRNRWPVIVAAAVAALVAIVFGTKLANRGARTRTAATPMVMQQVTNSGKVIVGAIAPDGKTLVYVTQDGAKHTVWNKQLSTGTHVRLIPPSDSYYYNIAFSPDADYVYYTASTLSDRNTANLFRVPSFGGEPRRIASDTEPLFQLSPDGRQVAFRRFNGVERVYVLTVADVETGVERQLVRRAYPDMIQSLAWTPDGTHITFVAYESRKPASASRLLETDVATGRVAETRFQRPKEWGGVSSLRWLPDGSGMLVTASGPRQPQQIWFMPAGGAEPRKVTADVSEYFGLSITSDGQTLVSHRGEVSANVWRVGIDGSNPVALTTGTGVRYGMGGVTTLPDGSILFVTQQDGYPHGEIVLRDGTRREFSHKLVMWEPRLSPDGKRVAFTSDNNGPVEIWTANIDGSDPRRVTSSGRSLSPAWFADSRSIAYVDAANGQHVWQVSLDTGERTQLTKQPTNWIGVSPDGKHLLCRLRITEPNPPPNSPLWRTAVVPLDGGPTRYYDVPRFGATPILRWLDANTFAFNDAKDGVQNIWTQDLAGGEPRQVTHFDSGVIFSFEASAKRGEIVLSRGDPVSDLVVIRNFR